MSLKHSCKVFKVYNATRSLLTAIIKRKIIIWFLKRILLYLFIVKKLNKRNIILFHKIV